ncbi:HAMP domain-containing protein [Parashewanella spongiae]|uniref:HAMP domain-containing protein n=1 Tax=Parashewanella spongiae TaxID=342950 RepID=A0A3A6U8P9_9GAMM|nr:methyl-accepting chemotaxis protein [Parashewanella spongiae]MCL1077607.1 methyl-accepting chemotaxis protein [Parashewanella spongiae]RJY13165.1 HAMP domain-containing protein [Parashewanella spongiae]
MRLRWIESLGITKKLALLILPLFFGCLAYSGILIQNKISANQNLTEVLNLTKLAENNSNLVHELQKERGMSAGFLGSNGRSFQNEIGGQRRAVDQKVQALKRTIAELKFDRIISSQLNRIINQLAELPRKRSQIDSLSITVGKQVEFYSSINELLLSVIDKSVMQSKDHDISVKVAAFSSYLQLKELAGIERAVLSSMFGNNEFSEDKFVKFVSLLSKQESYQERFLALSNSENIGQYQTILRSKTHADLQTFRELVLNRSLIDISSQSPEVWFSVATSRIDLLRQFEKKLTDEITWLTQAKLAKSNRLLVIHLITLVVLVLLIASCSFAIAKYLQRTIKAISDKVMYAGQRLDLTVRINHESDDEFGELSKSFNGMMDEFEQVINNAKNSAETISEVVDLLSSSSKQMQSDVDTGTLEAEQVASAMTEMSATVSQIAGNAADASKASNEANQEAREGNIEVEQTDRSIKELAEEMKVASNTINSLDKEINSIVGVLDVISGIAEQTNLLALNAAIEAARAGESGRGFAVVADEVRGLAQRAKSSTTDIKSMTERLQIGAEDAVQAMTRGLIKADESVKDVQNVGQDLKKIAEFVGVIDNMNIQIATATHQQSSVTEDVNSNAIKINELYQSSQSITREINELNIHLSKATHMLTERVNQFTVS